MRLRVKSRGRLAAFVAISLAITALVTIQSLGSAAGHSAGSVATEREVIVGPGDTLWRLAREYGPGGIDPRLAVYRLRQHNSLATAMLQPGQRIKLPPGWHETK